MRRAGPGEGPWVGPCAGPARDIVALAGPHWAPRLPRAGPGQGGLMSACYVGCGGHLNACPASLPLGPGSCSVHSRVL